MSEITTLQIKKSYRDKLRHIADLNKRKMAPQLEIMIDEALEKIKATEESEQPDPILEPV